MVQQDSYSNERPYDPRRHTYADLAKITGWTVAKVKEILDLYNIKPIPQRSKLLIFDYKALKVLMDLRYPVDI